MSASVSISLLSLSLKSCGGRLQGEGETSPRAAFSEQVDLLLGDAPYLEGRKREGDILVLVPHVAMSEERQL